MYRLIAAALLGVVPFIVSAPATAQDSKAWVAESDAYTNRLLAVELKHSPETGSQEGLAKFDTLISKPTLADELAERQEFVTVLADLKLQQAKETNQNVAEDLEILQKAFDLRFRREDYEL